MLSTKDQNHLAVLEQRLDGGGWRGQVTPGAPFISDRVEYAGTFPKISRTLARGSEGAEHVKSGPDKGRVIIKNMRHERSLCDQHGFANKYDLPTE